MSRGGGKGRVVRALALARAALAGALLVATAAAAAAAVAADDLYREPYRPQLHFSPARHWMNDPNGMVYVDGEYHLFYQYHPYGNRWGPMHWGHAVSPDLVHWRELPIALYPDAHGAIFSGSAVFDRDNTSGLGTATRPPLVALFAYHNHDLERQGAVDVESQGLAYSLDAGRSWAKYRDNPVLKNPGIRDFRDPKVSWFAPTRRWIMALAARDQVSFYSSRDLKHWQHESDFGRGLGAHGGVWECPDLVDLRVDGGREHRFVLLVSVNPGAPNGGSGTQYFVGRFDGHRFTPDANAAGDAHPATTARWLDYGSDDYAGVTWSNIPASDGRTLLLGWMSNWNYAQDVPTERWRSAMTLPRELSLHRDADGLSLHSEPVAELKALRKRSAAIPARHIDAPTELVGAELRGATLLELEFELDLRASTGASLSFRNSQGEQAVLRLDRAQRRIELDRSASGATAFNKDFTALQTAPLAGGADSVKLQIFLDHSSVEVFVNGGATVLTALLFPHQPYQSVTLGGEGVIGLTGGSVHELESIWPATQSP